MPLRCLIDLDASSVLMCESKASGRAVLGDEWDAPRVDYLATDSWQTGPAFITRETHPRRHGVANVIHVGPRDLYTITTTLGEIHLMRDGKIPSWKHVLGYFYGNPNDALKTMIAAACDLRPDPAITAFANRAYSADASRWDGIRAAAARHRIGHRTGPGRLH